MSQPLSLVAVVLVCLTTLAVGGLGLRLSRRTSDFYVAGRTVSPRLNASAIGGEYLSAASFLGVAGLVYGSGVDMLWLPIGYTLGYLVLLVMVAAPMRRSGAYTLPDFAEARLGSRAIRLVSSVLVVAIGWLYLVPQFQGAGLTLTLVTGAPQWVGGLVVMVVIAAAVGAGGMRSITFVQAVQYWVKLTALAVPAFVLLFLWFRAGHPAPVVPPEWHSPLRTGAPDDHTLYRTASTVLALSLGTMGLPHVLVRYYTNPDGVGARRTTVTVIALLGTFYLLPPVYAALGRVVYPTLPDGVRQDSIVLRIPGELAGGLGADLLTAMLAGGAFAAFLSTASGLAMSVTGVIDQEVLRPRLARLTGGDAPAVRGFRFAAVAAVVLPYLLSRAIEPLGLATTVGLAFAVAAATFAPLIILGVWWRRLSTTGALAGVLTGGTATVAALGTTMLRGDLGGWVGALLANPALWAVPLAAGTAVAVSLLTPGRVPATTTRTMVRLHTPERIALARSRVRD
ncbi:cation acetate symporter [Phycicoccus sp. CSK15P-2]|uniref:sodium/solute symporter n=1 Tax=Phycicoccus sp. CSK15P-2 TaxID=2807627 RepID=UPI00195252A0|nr:cation acetate symporter [Phycicoccus sp. CSK15P-2]MBM6404580.1 cation acetate symporter [Phycicoccus sp. CSK15P-2]